jgi:hypothetical protein
MIYVRDIPDRSWKRQRPSAIRIDASLMLGARVGFPNAATRDYKTVAYPFGTGVVYSSIFVIGT